MHLCSTLRSREAARARGDPGAAQLALPLSRRPSPTSPLLRPQGARCREEGFGLGHREPWCWEGCDSDDRGLQLRVVLLKLSQKLKETPIKLLADEVKFLFMTDCIRTLAM